MFINISFAPAKRVHTEIPTSSLIFFSNPHFECCSHDTSILIARPVARSQPFVFDLSSVMSDNFILWAFGFCICLWHSTKSLALVLMSLIIAANVPGGIVFMRIIILRTLCGFARTMAANTPKVTDVANLEDAYPTPHPLIPGNA